MSERVSLQDAVNEYRGKKKKIYFKAMQDIRFHGVLGTDSNIKMFVKPDRYPEDVVADKSPRAIQYRHPRYNLALATYLKPFEHVFYEHPGMDGLRVVTKGLNYRQIADLFIQKSQLYKRPVYLSLDHSKFDSTVNEDHLRFEHRQYNRVYKDNTLRKLLKKQLFNKGYSRHGIKYTIRGTRMSGDYNTGLGNSLLNRVVLESFCRGVKHSIMLDGDDSVVIVEKEALDKLDFSHFERMGFQTKWEVNTEMTKVVFCQKQIVFSNPPTMCRDFHRALSHMAVCLKRYVGKGFARWLAGVFECEAFTNKNMPLFSMLLGLVKMKGLRDEEWYRKMSNETEMLGDYVDYQAFSATFDIPIHTIKLFEEALSNTFGYHHIADYGGKSDCSSAKLVIAQLGQRYNACPSHPDAWWDGSSTCL